MESVLYESKHQISFITFNRPEMYNAMDESFLKQMLEIIKKVEKSTDRIVIVHGKGAAFSAGGDVAMMGSDDVTEKMESMMDLINEITIRWYGLKKITIAAIHGSVAGLGLSFALNNDYMIAHEKTKMGMLFAGVGLMPDGGGHFFLKEKLGVHHAKQFIWSMQQVDVGQAKKMGMVDEITSENILEAATRFANQLLQLPFTAAMKTKEAYHNEQIGELKRFLAIEKEEQIKLSHSENHQEGVRAFLEKRKPKFI